MTRTAALALVAFATVSPVRAEEQASPVLPGLLSPERPVEAPAMPSALVP
jgi:Sec-independent protein secretion pathway component TatC